MTVGHRNGRVRGTSPPPNGTHEARVRLDALLEVTHDAVITIDERGIIDTFNRAAQHLFGYTAAEAIGRNVSLLMPPPHAVEHDAYLARYLTTGVTRIIGVGRETVGRRRDGSVFPIALAVMESRVHGQRLFTGVIRDLSSSTTMQQVLDADRLRLEVLVAERTAALLDANRRLELLAATDPLTGLANRRRFDESLTAEMSRATRVGSPLSLLLCDIDCFKQFNDTYGHPAGDACLRSVASAMQGVFRRTVDLTARYGGEEFAVILPGADLGESLALADCLRTAVWELGLVHGCSTGAGRVTLSIGVVALDGARHQTPAALLDSADRAMYRAKQSGRNRVCAME